MPGRKRSALCQLWILVKNTAHLISATVKAMAPIWSSATLQGEGKIVVHRRDSQIEKWSLKEMLPWGSIPSECQSFIWPTLFCSHHFCDWEGEERRGLGRTRFPFHTFSSEILPQFGGDGRGTFIWLRAMSGATFKRKKMVLELRQDIPGTCWGRSTVKGVPFWVTFIIAEGFPLFSQPSSWQVPQSESLG